MNFEIILSILLILVFITILYRLIPHRIASHKKPVFSLLPKYKTEFHTTKDDKEIEERLTGFGFRNTGTIRNASTYTRGSVLGDFSINLAKVNIRFEKIASNKAVLCIEAGWIVLFDTGDFWTFIKELSEKLEDAS